MLGRCAHPAIVRVPVSAIGHPLEPDEFYVSCPDCGGNNTLKKHDFCEECFGKMIHMRTRHGHPMNLTDTQEFACSKCKREYVCQVPNT